MLIDLLSERLLLPTRYVSNLAAGASHHYKSYFVPKRRGGRRLIEHPSKQLKAVQRWLAANVICHFPVHNAARGYRRGTNIAHNAQPHAASRFLVRVDLVEFFPSLTAADVAKLLHASLVYVPDGDKWNDEDVDVFVRLCCKDGRLTIGAPTSPPLSNALCYHLDLQLTAFADQREMMYTRYADDLVFSARVPNQFLDIESQIAGVLRSLDFPTGLAINATKTWHASRRGRRKVTGVVITSEGKLSVGRGLKRRLRTLVYKYYRLSAAERKNLAGWLAHVRSIEPDFINRLILKYGAEHVIDAARPPKTL